MLSDNFCCTVGQQRVWNADIVGEFGLGLRDPGLRIQRVNSVVKLPLLVNI
jgi:hypothetical protein